MDRYDVIVVGGGHAGCEAAAAAAKLGSKTLLVTMNLQTIGQMSCNPAMGGVAKGQIVREIDALGGLSGIITDKTTIQFRMLNRSKGPAMWSPRAQCDRWRFSEEWRLALEGIPNLDFCQDMCTGLLVKNHKVEGIKTSLGQEFKASAVVLTNGTFLNGVIHIGEKNFGGGRAGEKSSTGLTEELVKLGFESGRMKTGTPPRIDGRSLDYSKFVEQKGDDIPEKFSFLNTERDLVQMSCWIAYTSTDVHDVLRTGFDRSPMYSGAIKGVGPRYCPSIEDKIDRFSDKDRHQLFVEPEGRKTVEVYVNGFSTSLPQEVQERALRLVPGFEKAKFFRPGYAIEYDYFPPTQLSHSMETKLVEGLFFAGQINGTTGYEEAACQGLVAGINAHNKVSGKPEFTLNRDDAYIGVLIDDLITKGTDEPYRMFTSRAEYRILLRQDNADLRLTEIGYELGLVCQDRYDAFLKKKEALKDLASIVNTASFSPKEINEYLLFVGESQVDQAIGLNKLILRPKVLLQDLLKQLKNNEIINFSEEVVSVLETEHKYAGYISREKDNANKIKNLEDLTIPKSFIYEKVSGLSIEARNKLSSIKPSTLGQASRVSGVSPADISVLMVFMGR